jgi:hypothetical protein
VFQKNQGQIIPFNSNSMQISMNINLQLMAKPESATADVAKMSEFNRKQMSSNA